jgi:hypothetical protein
MENLKENIQKKNIKKLMLFISLGMFCYCSNNASTLTKATQDVPIKEDQAMLSDKLKQKTKEQSEEKKRVIDKKEIKKRERKIERYKGETKKLKGEIIENLKKEEEINVQKEQERIVFNKKINKEKEIARENAQVIVKGNNKKISGLEKSLEDLQKKKTTKKNKKKIQKDIEEKEAEIKKLKRKNDDILLDKEKAYEEKIKSFDNKFSVKIENIKALKRKKQKKIAELENLIDAIQREIDIISNNGYKYFIQYSKKEKSSKIEEVLDKATEEKKGEDLPGEEIDKKEEKFDLMTKNKVFGVKNSSILIGSNFSWDKILCDKVEIDITDKSNYSVIVKSDFSLNFNRAKENKIYKKLKFSVDLNWKQNLDIAQKFLPCVKEKEETWEKSLTNKIKAKYNFYKNEKIKIGFTAEYIHPLFFKEKNLDPPIVSLSLITTLKKIKTSFKAGVSGVSASSSKYTQLTISKYTQQIGKKVENMKYYPFFFLSTKTEFKYCDLIGYFSIQEVEQRPDKPIIFLLGELKVKKIKYLEDTSVKIYFNRRTDISADIVGISPTCKLCLNKMNIFKILGVEKFTCKLKVDLKYAWIYTAKSDPRNGIFKLKLDLNIGIIKLKESRFKKLGKLQLNIFKFTCDNFQISYQKVTHTCFFDVFIVKYNILKKLSLSLHVFNFKRRQEEANYQWVWVPSLEIKFDVAKYLLAKKKK